MKASDLIITKKKQVVERKGNELHIIGTYETELGEEESIKKLVIFKRK